MTFEQLLSQGHQYITAQAPRDAIPLFLEILNADPNHVAALAGLAKATLQLNDPATASQMLEIALAKAPDDPDILNAAGYAQLALGDCSAALEKFEAALVHSPGQPGILLNLASACCGTSAYDRAEEIYQRLEAMDGHADATVQYNHSLLLLLQGRFSEAWPGFELRREATNTGLLQRKLPGQTWDGSERRSGHLLVHAEQGLGDNIQFIRYLPMVASRVGRVTLEAPKVLMELFEKVPGIDNLLSAGAALPDCDWHVSIMSLPALCRTVEETIPAHVPYLSVEEDAVERWGEKLDVDDGRRHVGLVWAGNPGHRRDRERSISLQTLVPALVGRNDVAFHAFQIGAPLAQVRDVASDVYVQPLFTEPQPMREVAAALSAVDLLISVDTALAHLAGALKRPVWTLITHVPDWRWMLGRVETPWYPTMRLFRQPVPGDWVSVVNAVGEALTAETTP